MSLNLEDIKGLGAKSVEKLKASNIDSVEQLAQMTVEDLSKVEGIGESSAKKYIKNANDLLSTKKESATEVKEEKKEETVEPDEALDKIAKEELKKIEAKKKKLQGKPVNKGDFAIVKLTGRTEKGQVFQVSSPEDAKTAGIYEEERDQAGYYSPEFMIIGQPGQAIEGVMETVETMNYFEKKTVRIPPAKGFGKRDPQKIERIAVPKFRKKNEGKHPEIGQSFTNKKGQRGSVVRVVQGRVIIDYNHPLAGQALDYIIEVVDKIEEFDRKIGYFIEARMPGAKGDMFKLNFKPDEKSIEIEIPQQFQFNQNILMFKFGLAMDLQGGLDGAIDTVRFVEVFEKPPTPEPHVHDHDHDHSEEKEEKK